MQNINYHEIDKHVTKKFNKNGINEIHTANAHKHIII